MKINISAILGCMILALVASINTTVAQQRMSPKAIPLGMPVTTLLECGEFFTELYDAKITVLQVLRGKEALDRIKAENPSAPAPKAGFDYLLARIAFEMKATTQPGKGTFELARKMQFVALTEDGNEIDAPLAAAPKPQLHRTVHASEPVEGWVVFQVEQSNKKPMMFFDPASGGAIGGGSVLFFQLY